MATKRVVLSAEIQGLADPLSKLSALDLALQETNQQLRITAKEIQELGKAGQPTEELRVRYDALKKEQFELREATKLLNQEVRTSVREWRKAEYPTGSLQELEAQYSQLRREIRAMSREEREGVTGADAIKRARALKDEIREVSEAFGDTTPNIGNYREAIEKAFQGQGGLIANLRSVTAGILGPAGLVAAFGAAVAGGVALGRFIVDTTREFDALRGSVELLTDASDEQINEVTARVKTLADLYGQDFQQVIVGVNAAQRAFGGDLIDVIDQVEEAVLAGANANDEYFDSLREYPTVVAAAGLSLEQFNRVIVQATQEGIYSDKAIDAIKEGNISLQEQTQATRDAVEAILGPAEADAFFEQINEGTKTTLDGLIELAQRAQEETVSVSERATLVADVFRGAGEDAGAELLRIVSELNDETSGLVDNTSEYVQRQRDLIQSTNRLNLAKSELAENFAAITSGGDSFFNNLKSFGIETLNSFILSIREFGRRIEALQNLNFQGLSASSGLIRQQIVLEDELNQKVEERNKKQEEANKSRAESLKRDFGDLAGDLRAIESALGRSDLTEKQRQFLEGLKEEAELIEQRNQVVRQYRDQLERISQTVEIFGVSQEEALVQRVDAARQAITALLETGLKPTSSQVVALIGDYADLTQQLTELQSIAREDEFIRDLNIKSLQEYNKALREQQRIIEQGRSAGSAAEADATAQTPDFGRQDPSQAIREETEKQTRLLDIQQRFAEVEARETIDKEKELQEELLRIEQDYELRRLQVRLQGLDEYSLEYRETLQQIRDLEKEQNEARKTGFRLTQEEIGGVAIEAASTLASTLATIQRSRQEQERQAQLAEIEEEYERRREAAAGNAAELERIDEQYEKEKSKIEREAAKERKDIAIKEAIIQGALSVIKALPNVALSIAAGLAAAAQLAIIQNQKFAAGGFTGPALGRPDDTGRVPVGIVHANEYVVPQEVVFNPRARPAIEYLEGMRKKRGTTRGVTRRLYAAGGLVADTSGSIPLYSAPAAYTAAGISDEMIERMAEQIAARAYEAVRMGSEQGSKRGTMIGSDESNRRAERDRQAETLRTF